MKLMTAIKKGIKNVEMTHGEASVWIQLKGKAFPYVNIYGKDDISMYCSFTLDDLESKDWVVIITY